jgi:hypothetical protein
MNGGQGGNRTPTAEGGWSTASGAHHLLNLPTGTGDGSSGCGPVVIPSPLSALGADDGTRTRNLRFTKPLLYQLSYVGAAQDHTADGPFGAGE